MQHKIPTVFLSKKNMIDRFRLSESAATISFYTEQAFSTNVSPQSFAVERICDAFRGPNTIHRGLSLLMFVILAADNAHL